MDITTVECCHCGAQFLTRMPPELAKRIRRCGDCGRRQLRVVPAEARTAPAEPAPGRLLLELMVRCDRFAPHVVREAMTQLPDGIGWVLGDAMLVTSELVTNAVRHSLCQEADLVTVAFYHRPHHVRISVLDPGASGTTAQIVDGADPFGGIGLKLVEQLVASWGAERHDRGYEVWADVAVRPREDAETNGA